MKLGLFNKKNGGPRSWEIPNPHLQEIRFERHYSEQHQVLDAGNRAQGKHSEVPDCFLKSNIISTRNGNCNCS